MKKVFVLGSINLDYIVKVDNLPTTGETVMGSSLEKVFGGKGANQAVACAKMGSKVTMIGAVGNDNAAINMVKNLNNNNINTKYIKEKNISSGAALITVSKDDNLIVVSPGANFEVKFDDVKECLEKEATKGDFFIVQFETPLNVVLKSIEYAKSKGLVVCLNPSPFKKFNIEILNKVDYLFINQSELSSILQLDSNIKDLKSLLKFNINIIYTLGKDGVEYYTNNKSFTSTGFKVLLKDPTAAGDSFLGSFVSSIIENKDVEEALILANASGAIATMKLGAQSSIPNIEEVLKFIKIN